MLTTFTKTSPLGAAFTLNTNCYMAILNYQQRLSNLQQRRFDQELNESILTKSFSRTDIPDDLKYLLESMKPIAKKSTDKTIEAAGRVQSHLEGKYELPFSKAYRTQGSIMTNSHIKVSDFDLLVIIDGYYYVAPGIPVLSPYNGEPRDDISEIRKQSFTILKAIYDEVDDSNEKCITIFNKALHRKVDVVFGFWYNTQKYNETNDEYYRGIKFKPVQPQPDYPFAHIQIVNAKGDATVDGSRKGIRLLKTLKEDCEDNLSEIKSFQLTSLIQSIDNSVLTHQAGNEIKIAQSISNHLNKVINYDEFRRTIESPNGLEKDVIPASSIKYIQRLKLDLDTLIEDSMNDLKNSYHLQKAVLNY
jgi:hypothetical protein